MSKLTTRIQLKHDIEANWNQVADSFVPLAGEACITTDGENKGKVKYGDGSSTWGQLPYSGGSDVIEVDASKVTFSKDMVFTYEFAKLLDNDDDVLLFTKLRKGKFVIDTPFGNYSPDSSGQVTIPSNGKTIEGLFEDAYVEEKNPDITQPYVSVSSSQMKAYEVGTKVTPSYTATLNP